MALEVYNPPAEGRLWVQDTSGDWQRVHNMGNFDFSGGDRTESTVEFIDNGSRSTAGAAQPKDVACTLNPSPGTPGYHILFDAYQNSKIVNLRFQTVSNQLEDNSTAAKTIAVTAAGVATGVQTKFQTNPNWIAGIGVKLPNQNLIFLGSTSETAATFGHPTGAAITQVSATDDWEIWEYGLRYVFRANVLSAGNITVTAGGDGFQDALTIKMVSNIPTPEFMFEDIPD